MQKLPKVTILLLGTFFCDFGSTHILHVLIFAICTQIWQTVMAIQMANVCECNILQFWANPQK